MDMQRLVDEVKFLDGMKQGILWVIQLAREEADKKAATAAAQETKKE